MVVAHGTVAIMVGKVMTTLTCVLGDGSTVKYGRNYLFSLSPVITSMMDESNERIVPLPLIPSKDRFVTMMKKGKDVNVSDLVNAANDANYIGYVEALEHYVKCLAYMVENGEQSEIHFIVDYLVPDVLTSVLRETSTIDFFCNVEVKRMVQSPQLLCVVEESQRFDPKFSNFGYALKGMERFDKFDLPTPNEEGQVTLKYLVCCVRDHNVEAVRKSMGLICASNMWYMRIGEAAAHFGCVDVFEMYGGSNISKRAFFLLTAIETNRKEVVEYLAPCKRNHLAHAMECAFRFHKKEILDFLVQKWKDAGFFMFFEKMNNRLANCLAEEYGFTLVHHSAL